MVGFEVTPEDLQQLVNGFAAKKLSHSFIHKVRTYLKAILDEAIEQDLLVKNPARKLEVPRTKEKATRHLSLDECGALLDQLSGRDQLIVRVFLVLGLRPGELFALRWNDIEADRIRIDESVWNGTIKETKTKASMAWIPLPAAFQVKLELWRSQCCPASDTEFVFASEMGSPLRANIFARRILKPASVRAGVAGVTFQAFRRTCATQSQKFGTIKDTQAVLRHSTPSMTLGVYQQAIPKSVAAAVEQWDRALSAGSSELATMG